jgi:hypothetical protein
VDTNSSICYLHDELIGLAHSGSDASNRAPRVHDGLAAGDCGAGLEGAVFEAPHHERDDHVSLFFRHLCGDGQEHQHVLALCDAHGVQVTEHVGAGDLA